MILYTVLQSIKQIYLAAIWNQETSDSTISAYIGYELIGLRHVYSRLLQTDLRHFVTKLIIDAVAIYYQ